MGDEYEILVAQDVQALLDSLDEKSERIVKENLAKLASPYPGEGRGDKEQITWRGNEIYRLHIGRTWTAFYDINNEDDIVRVLRVMPINEAHKEYGSLE